jgi:hypothetical protein
MRKLLQQLEEMHIRIAETATGEETLVKALGDALARLDQQLLQDVQNIASEHEVRRGAILEELQGLASSIGMFRAPPLAVAARPDIEPEAAEHLPANGHTYAIGAGDWREATSNMRDEFDVPATGRAPRAPFPHEQRRGAAPLSLTERRRRANGG